MDMRIRILHVVVLLISSIFAAATPTQGCVKYWIDREQPDDGTIVHINSENVSFDIDLHAYAEGYHILRYMICSENGTCSPVHSRLFYIDEKKQCYSSNTVLQYSIDDDAMENVAITKNGNVSKTLDLRKFEEGLHFLRYRIVNGETKSPVFSTAVFRNAERQKVEWGKIWWNDDVETIETCLLDERETDYFLSKEIRIPQDVANQELADGKAKINLIFGNTDGWCSEIMSAEVDCSGLVTGIEEVVGDGTKWTVGQENGGLVVRGLIPGNGKVSVFSINGIRMFSDTPQDETMYIPFLQGGVYLVTYGKGVCKIEL